MEINLKRLNEQAQQWIWDTDPVSLPLAQRFALYLSRLVIAVTRDIIEGQLTLRAMSLVYTTLLSIVPLLALSFSVLKALGAHQWVEPFLLETLAPLGDQRQVIVGQIIGFVDNMKVAILGSLGLVMLIYTVVSLVQKIERAFNFIWHVSDMRPMSERFSSYLSVIMIGPVLVVSAAGITASVASSAVMQQLSAIEPIGWFFRTIGPLVPWVLVTITFALIYLFIPNTKVKLSAALAGAVVASIMWKLTALLFSMFVVQSAKTEAIYSGFAIVIFLLMWTYLVWMILLIGSNVSYYVQNKEHMYRRRQSLKLSPRMHEQLALAVMFLAGRRYSQKQPGPSLDEYAAECRVSPEALDIVVANLFRQGLLVPTRTDPVRYVPGADVHRILVTEILRAARQVNENRHLNLRMVNWPAPVRDIQNQIESSIEEALGQTTLFDLVTNPDLS